MVPSASVCVCVCACLPDAESCPLIFESTNPHKHQRDPLSLSLLTSMGIDLLHGGGPISLTQKKQQKVLGSGGVEQRASRHSWWPLLLHAKERKQSPHKSGGSGAARRD